MVAIKNIVSTASLLSSVAFAYEAPYNTDSKKKSVARAHLDKGLIKGMIEFTSKKGVVDVHLDVTGLPENGGPFQYEIYDSKVSSGSDCYDAGSPFNPYAAVYNKCDDLSNDAECAVGDLSGKHGFINTTCFETQYTDPYLSLNPNNDAFVGDKSLVITDQNNVRISCGAIKMKKSSKMNKMKRNVDTNQYPGLYNELAAEPYHNATTNSTNFNYGDDEETTTETSTYDSSSNTLSASGLMGAIAAVLASVF